MKRLAIVATLGSLLAACVLQEFTADISSRPQGLTAVGRCFALRRDAYVLMAPKRIAIDQPERGELDVFGAISVEREAEQSPRQKLRLAAGTRLTVERVLSHYYPQVGHLVTPYVRIPSQFDNRYVDSSSVFEPTYAENPLLPIAAYLEPCN